jgi:glycine cleavage system pyridoxal-binding protein P
MLFVVVEGSSVPMGYGGPHAAFLSCHDEFKRCGCGFDTSCLWLLQTEEQHCMHALHSPPTACLLALL